MASPFLRSGQTVSVMIKIFMLLNFLRRFWVLVK